MSKKLSNLGKLRATVYGITAVVYFGIAFALSELFSISFHQSITSLMSGVATILVADRFVEIIRGES